MTSEHERLLLPSSSAPPPPPPSSMDGGHYFFEIDAMTSEVYGNGNGKGNGSSNVHANNNNKEVNQEEEGHVNDNMKGGNDSGGEKDFVGENTTATATGATVFQTSLNIAKLCMGTGTLALPFASQKGGLIFNIIGLGFIGLWNYYSADCLLRCLDVIVLSKQEQEQKEIMKIMHAGENGVCDGEEMKKLLGSMGNNGTTVGATTTNDNYGAILNGNSYGDIIEQTTTTSTTYSCENTTKNNDDMIIDNEGSTTKSNNKKGLVPPPPEGTTTYGMIAWYASGPNGLMVLDALMLLLFIGLLIAYEVAMMSFISDMPLTTGSKKLDLLLPSILVSLLSCAPDISFLSHFSVLGLLALTLSFTVISYQGIQSNGLSGFYNLHEEWEMNAWPKNWTDASSWFGVVVFGYGVVPVIFNIRDSMARPEHIGLSTKIGLFIVFVGYITISNGVRVLFSPTHVFEGDVLQALPDTWISLIVRLLMTFVVAVTAPLIVVPCGELIEGKLGIEESDHFPQRVIIRILLCIICTILAEFAPGFVHVVSFIGCFCVAMAGFVLPPLFSIQLAMKKNHGDGQSFFGKGCFCCCQSVCMGCHFMCDIGLLVVGVIATVITSTLTFIEMIDIR